jgi:high frequency lysogenization protein
VRASIEERVIALAGVVQAAHLVSNAAQRGMVSQTSLEVSINSIFVTSPNSVADVYGDTQGVALGIKLLKEMLTHLHIGDHGELLRYSLSLIALERRLARQPDVLDELGLKIQQIDEHRRIVTPPVFNEALLAELASLYQSSPGQLTPRIRIVGKRQHLENQNNVNRMRALLLAGIRSAVLWHQLGGRRSQLIFGRGAMRRALDYVLSLHKYR